MPKKVVSSTTQHFAERRLKAIEERMAVAEKFAEKRIAAATRARIDDELKALVGNGQVLPVEIKAGKFEYLYDLPVSGVVVKFSEGGKATQGSPLDKALSILKAGPKLIRFGELVKDPIAEKNADDIEVSKVEAFARSPKGAKALEAAGKTPQQFVEKFSETRKKDPTWTAARVGAV